MLDKVQKFASELPFVTIDAKKAILRVLENAGQVTGIVKLERNVLAKINVKHDRFGKVIYHKETFRPIRETKPVHRLAFVVAYKRLEKEGKIEILRPQGIPFPMTDNETTFKIGGRV